MEVSAYSLAERKYRNIKPWATNCIGLPRDSTTSKKRYIKSASTQRDVQNQRSETQIKFNSIPAICFLPQSQNIVTSEFASPNCPECRVQIFDNRGKLITSFSTEADRQSRSTFGVTVASEDDSKIAVCTGRGIGIFTLEGKVFSNMTANGVQNCCHVTKMANGLLATTCITDIRGRCVTLWDPSSGKIVSQFGSRSEVIELNPLKATQKVIIRKTDIRLPWFLTSNSRDEIFIADRNAGCIKMFDVRNGSYVTSFDTCGTEYRQQKSILPQGICTDEDDNIIVADSLSKSLLLFDRHGEFVKTLASESKGMILGEPWAVAITTNPKYQRPICRSRCQGDDNARTLIVSAANPKPFVTVYKMSFCPHYTNYM